MSIGSILLVIIIIVLLYVALRYIFSDVNTLTGISSATIKQTIDASTLASSGANTSNFTYSVWFYVDDWNYKYGDPKVLFARSPKTSTTDTVK